MPLERKTLDIFISDDLRDVLKEIESESNVASLLLKKRHYKDELVDNPINYISISVQDKTKISYLTKERIELLEKENGNTLWTSSRRFQAKPGSFISKIFKNISPKDVEKFSNLFRSQSSKQSFNFDIVKGNKIKKYYSYESYASSERGSLGASCMKHEGCQEFFDLYTENKDILSMLVMLNDSNELIGRALLWDFESYKIMDRIYTLCDEDLSYYFKQWATKNGYLYKSEQNWCNTMSFEQIGSKKQELKLKIKLPNSRFNYYPYMDTFKFLDTDNGILYNYIPVDKYGLYTLASSEGSKYDNSYLVLDDIDRVFRHRADIAYLGYLNINTSCDNAVWSEINNTYILNKDAIYDDEMGEYLFNVSLNHLNNNEVIDQYRENIKKKIKPNWSNISIGDRYYTIDNSIDMIDVL